MLKKNVVYLKRKRVVR